MTWLAARVGLALLVAAPLAAQRGAPDCTYRACALGIAPAFLVFAAVGATITVVASRRLPNRAVVVRPVATR